MRIELPLEVWVDVFASIYRWELARLVDSLGSRQFAAVAMFFLHKYGQIKLGNFEFGGYSKKKMAEVEMPANIKDFESIYISADFICQSSLAASFVHLQPLLTNVNLWCYDSFSKNEVPDCLEKILPLIKSFNSINLSSDHESFKLLHEKFTDKFFAAKIISINFWGMVTDQRERSKNNVKQPQQQESDESGDDDSADENNANDEDKAIDDDHSEGNAANENAEQNLESFPTRILAILRQWLWFYGNGKGDDGIASNEDEEDRQPRLLYVDDIPLKLCLAEMDIIANEFMQFTKPFCRFIVCFFFAYYPLDADQRKNVEMFRHLNPSTQEILSAKCFEFEQEYSFKPCCAIFLHCHPLGIDEADYAGDMLLIDKMLEAIIDIGKYIPNNSCRQIFLRNEFCWSDLNSSYECSYDYWQELEEIELKEMEAKMDFLWQEKELRIEAFERRMKSRKMALDKLIRKKNGNRKKEKAKTMKQKHGRHIEMIFGAMN